MARNIDTVLFRAFVVTAEARSMTAASQTLNLTQSAVSHQIGKLEQLLGVRLFNRSRGGLTLTAAGRRLHAPIVRLLLMHDKLLEDATGQKLSGEIRLGVPPDLANGPFAIALRTFCAAHPRMEVKLISATSPELEGLAAKHMVDVALVQRNWVENGDDCLATERLVWVGAKGGAVHRKRPLTVSLVSETCAFRPAIIKSLEARNINWRMRYETGDLEVTNSTIRADLAISARLLSTVGADMAILGRGEGLPPLPTFAIHLLRIDEGVQSAQLSTTLEGVYRDYYRGKTDEFTVPVKVTS